MKKAISFLLMVVLITTVFAYTPSTEVAAKSKKKKAKTQTTAILSEEAAHFTIDTWKPTYSNWSKKEIEKADAKGTGLDSSCLTVQSTLTVWPKLLFDSPPHWHIYIIR